MGKSACYAWAGRWQGGEQPRMIASRVLAGWPLLLHQPACAALPPCAQVGGMNVARLNLAHGSHDYHRAVVQRIRKLNREKGFSVAIMVR